VKTNDSTYPNIVLEARSTKERDWLVFSLKLIVARLASIIITRDEEMLHEFFSPYSALIHFEEEVDIEEDEDLVETPRQNHSYEGKSRRHLNPPDRYATPMEGKATAKTGAESDDECCVTDYDTGEEQEEGIDVIFTDDESDASEAKSNDDFDDHSAIDVPFNSNGHQSSLIAQVQSRDDDEEQEDSIRSRSATLKRSLSEATGSSLFESSSHSADNVPRTFSY